MADSGQKLTPQGALRQLVILALLVGGAAFFHGAAPVVETSRATLMLAFGFIVLAGHSIGQLVGFLGLPRISGYLISGIVFGPSAPLLLGGLRPGPPFDHGILTHDVIDDLALLDTLAVALIALTAGGELKLDAIRRGIREVLSIIAGRVVAVYVVVTAVVAGLVMLVPAAGFTPSEGPSLAAALAIGALVASVMTTASPAATIAVINDLGATGPLSRTTLTTVVLGDVPVVVIFAVTSVLAGSVLGVSSGEQSLGTYLATHIAGSLAVGVGLGAVLALYVRYINRELLLFLVASIYAGSLIIKAGEFDPVLTFLGAGFVVANFSKGAEPLIESVERLSKPVYVLFFALAGAKLHLQELATAWWVAVILAGSRLLAVRSGARFGAKIAGSPQVVQDNVWLGLISQAGVSLALAGIIGSRFGDFGARLQTVLVSAIGIHEFIGPVLLKFGLSRAGEIQGQRETTSPGERTSSAPPPRLSMADDVDLELLARRASPWGPPAETASDALNQALEKLREDLDRAMHAAESASVERFQSSVESFVGELRREFQRHHRRALLRVREANGDAVKVAAVLHAELAHLAERWRSAALARSARLAQANWSPDSLIEVVDRIVEALPEGIDAPYEARALDTRVRRRFVAALGARWLRIRRRAARMVRVELRRTVQLRALARYHLAGLVPGRLEPFVVLLVDAELRVARETRGLLDRVARQNVEIEELLARPEKVNVEQELERVREAFEDHVTQFEKSFVNQVVRTRDKLEDAIARSYSDVRHEAAVFGTPDLPLRQRRTNRVFRDRMRALDVFGDRLERVRQVVSATYTQIALECELVALEARIRDVIADHAKQFARNVRGRTHVQAERLVEALDGALPTMAETVEAEQQGEALEQALEAQMEPLKRTAHEVARQSNLVVEELSREAVLKPLLDALRAATRSLSDRYEIPSGPLMLGDQRLEAPSSIVDVPFRELVTAHVETSVVPNLLDVMREVRDLIKPFSQTLQDVERAMAFNLELVVNELELFHGRAVTEEVREVVRELLLATVEKHRDMARGLEKKASAWPGTLREGVDRAVLGSVADLRGQLMDGELSQIRVAMMRRSAAGKKLVFQANRLPALFPEFREAVRRATSGLVREEQLDAWREELGIPRRRKARPLTPAAFAAPAALGAVPLVYTRLFSTDALEATDVITGRDTDIETAHEMLTSRGQGRLRTVALVGPDGVGKGSVSNAILRRTTLRNIKRVTWSGPVTVRDVDDALRDLGEGSLVFVHGFFWLASLRPGGFEPLRRFVDTVIRDAGKNAWLLEVDNAVWDLASTASSVHDAFPFTIELEPLPPRELEAAVLARHNLSQYGLSFDPGPTGSPIEDAVQRVAVKVRRPYDSFFRALHAASGGLIRDALRHWLAAVDRIDEDNEFVHMGRVKPSVQRALRELPTLMLLKLHQVERQGWMNAPTFASLFRLGVEIADAELAYFAHLGLLERTGTSFRVASHIRGPLRTVVQQLGWVG